MLRSFALVCCVIIYTAFAFALKTKTVTVEYVYYAPETMSLDKAKATALERAKAQAIENEFGSIILQNNITHTEIADGESYTEFSSIGGSELKGEWLETLKEPTYELMTDAGMIAIKVTVRGRIREVQDNKAPVLVKTFRNGVSAACESSDFVCGDSFYMSFSSSTDGYLAIYLVDEDNKVYCLLPYQSQSGGIYRTKANCKHLLFDKNSVNQLEADTVDELIMDTDKPRVKNHIYTIFSPNKFFKAVDNSTDASLPRSLSYDEFTKWLSDVRKKDVDLTVSNNIITIVKE